MWKYLLLCLTISGCSYVEPKFKKDTRVTLKKEGYCNAYVVGVTNTGFKSVFSSKEEPKYILELNCKSRDLIYTQPVSESELREVPRKTTREQWQVLRAKGPKFKTPTKISDSNGCKGTTSYPYLNDDGEWFYPLSNIDCPKGESHSFSTMMEEEDISLLVDN